MVTSEAPVPALGGIRVVDLSRVLAGPYCTMMLSDFGADVIKIEAPGSGDDTRQWGPPYAGGESAYYLAVNRNKRSITLNLKSEEGRSILRELVRCSHILVENFKVGTMAGWGLGYADLRSINPRLVYCAISGYGQDGPLCARAGYDFVIQAQGGLMGITGPAKGAPYKLGVAISDIAAGLYAFSSILAALRVAERDGEGQFIDISLLDTTVACLANVASNHLVSGQPTRRYGNAHPNIVPYQDMPAADGRLALAVGNDGQFRRLCQILGQPALATDPRFATNAQRVANRSILISLLEPLFRQKGTAEWVESLNAAGIPCGPINRADQALNDPHVLARGLVHELPHPTAGKIRLVGPPQRLSRTPPAVVRHPPLLGQDTDAVLSTVLGYSAAHIAELREQGVV